ncbi:MAG TPA: hypothetical protein VFU21_06590 [Kofleriaceae bacterium]|nr:hypothetical protein [Kofleriaceae bacterium]
MQPSALVRGAVLLAGLAAAGLPAACGSGSDSDADAGPGDGPDAGDPDALDCQGRSGTRIRQVIRNHADGSRQFVRLHDAELGETCAFGLAADSSLRCIPLADGSPFAAGAVMYTDPGCGTNNRIAQLTAAVGDPPPTHMQQQVAGGTADGCGAVTFNYQLGNQLTIAPETTIYRKDPDDQCVGVSAGSNPYFEIAAELAPDGLVAGTESWVGQGRIQQRRLDGEDGSRWCDIDSFRDLELETSCSLQFGEDNSIQCLPAALGIGAFFSTDTCGAGSELPLMVVPGSCDSGARYALESAIAACPYRRRVRALGAEYTDPYYQNTGTCVAVDDGSDTAYRVGPAMSGTSFASFTRTYIAAGGDRLERGDLDNSLGLRFFRFQWRDTTLDLACSFQTLADESIRCIPTTGSQEFPVATVTSLFSDAGCTAAVQVGQIDLTCFGGAEPTHAVDGERVYPLTGPAPATYRMDGACVQVTDVALFTLGAEIPADMFVSGEEATE